MSDSRAPEKVRAVEGRDVDPSRPLARGGEAFQHLRQSLERVDRERQGLMRVASSLEEFVRSQESRYSEVEQELNDTALLYVASYQLQARAEPREVLRHLRELLEQLIGVESFVMYLASGENALQPVTSRGVPEGSLTTMRITEGPLAGACSKRAPVIAPELPSQHGGSPARPLAVVPLLLNERVVGVISILKLFAHKANWAQVDGQLLHLLATHAASALLAAHLVRQVQQKDLFGTLVNLGEGLK